MHCSVYKSLRKAQTYVYVPFRSDLADLPEALQGLLGELEKVLDVALDSKRKLARVDASEVMRCIDEQGFFVQMPPGKDDAMGLHEPDLPGWMQ